MVRIFVNEILDTSTSDISDSSDTDGRFYMTNQASASSTPGSSTSRATTSTVSSPPNDDEDESASAGQIETVSDSDENYVIVSDEKPDSDSSPPAIKPKVPHRKRLQLSRKPKANISTKSQENDNNADSTRSKYMSISLY